MPAKRASICARPHTWWGSSGSSRLRRPGATSRAKGPSKASPCHSEILRGRLEAIAPLFHAELEFAAHAGIGNPTAGRGLQALIEAWRDWMQPFETWRTEVERFVALDEDRVLVLIRDHVRPRGGNAEIESLGCSLWRLSNGKVARIDFYPTRSEGLEAAGLRG